MWSGRIWLRAPRGRVPAAYCVVSALRLAVPLQCARTSCTDRPSPDAPGQCWIRTELMSRRFCLLPLRHTRMPTADKAAQAGPGQIFRWDKPSALSRAAARRLETPLVKTRSTGPSSSPSSPSTPTTPATPSTPTGKKDRRRCAAYPRLSSASESAARKALRGQSTASSLACSGRRSWCASTARCRNRNRRSHGTWSTRSQCAHSGATAFTAEQRRRDGQSIVCIRPCVRRLSVTPSGEVPAQRTRTTRSAQCREVSGQ